MCVLCASELIKSTSLIISHASLVVVSIHSPLGVPILLIAGVNGLRLSFANANCLNGSFASDLNICPSKDHLLLWIIVTTILMFGVAFGSFISVPASSFASCFITFIVCPFSIYMCGWHSYVSQSLHLEHIYFFQMVCRAL